MLNKINLLRFLIVVLFLSLIAAATETTWRHSGFEISGYDINGSSTYNLTEIRKIEFGWNTSIPAVSETSRAVMYYDDNQKRIMQSLNGGAYQAIVDNTTVNAYTVNAANATGVLPNVSIPATALNLSSEVGVISVSKSADQLNIPDGIYVLVTWETEAWDNNSNFASNNFTAPVTGKYQMNVALLYTSGSSSYSYELNVYVNGISKYNGFNPAAANGQANPKVSRVIKLNAGDVVGVYTSNTDTTDGSDINSNLGNTYWDMTLIREG